MKKIIENLLYDTETSELIYNDVDRRREYYMTPNKRFFVKYASGEFEVRTEDVMKDFLGKVDAEKYIEIFGDVQEA